MNLKKCMLGLLMLTSNGLLFAQEASQTNGKPPVDANALKKWALVAGGVLSNDGNYVYYKVFNQPAGTRRLIVQSTHTEWKKEFSGITTANFSNDSKQLIFKTGKDSLILLTLGAGTISCISNAGEYKIPDEGNWIGYMSSSPVKELVLRNLATGKELRFDSVSDYFFTGNGQGLLLQTEGKKDSKNETVLQWVSLSDGKLKNIWSNSDANEKAGNCSFDINGEQLAFIVEKKKENLNVNELWYYKPGMDQAVMLANDQTAGIDSGLALLGQMPEFSKDGRHIFIGLKSTTTQKPDPDAVSVDVWSYRDTKLQSLQLAEAKQSTAYIAVFNITEKKLIRLNKENEIIVARSNDFVLVGPDLGNYGALEASWNVAVQPSYYGISTKDGSRKLVRDHVVEAQGTPGLSPGGKWVIYYDFKQDDFFSYETATGITRNITKGSGTQWLDEENDRLEPKLCWIPWRDTWLTCDAAVLINDSYDMWLVDPTGIKAPVNLTNGYGRKNNIKFELLGYDNELKHTSVKKGTVLLFKTFNKINKDYGFYSITLGKTGDPELRSKGPYVYGNWDGYDTYNYPPDKAKNADTWLVKRMNAVEAPNYFITRDFKNFRDLTNVQPQAAYNWMAKELHTWKSLDGETLQGLLYKPENFDPAKKYPVIFDYYEKRSDELNLFIWPKAAEDRINIARFVSKGYLVFTPDIHYKMGEPGQSAYKAVVSAAGYLSKMPFVDATKMGLQGHSFGGYETNYIITHTNLFAAACSASGICDLISWYGSNLRQGYPKYWAEREQGRIGAMPWERPDQYISNSPIFLANKVNTPLLMMANKNDTNVPFAQGVEWFTALRRLGKKVWMLQYDEGGHSVGRGKVAEDFDLRMTQFFDHYLKDAPAPKWMVEGIPAKMKGIDDGLTLEPAGIEPGPGLDKEK